MNTRKKLSPQKIITHSYSVSTHSIHTGAIYHHLIDESMLSCNGISSPQKTKKQHMQKKVLDFKKSK